MDNFWLLIGLAILGLLNFELTARADDRIKIGIIDSGISIQQSKSKILCKDGLKSTFSDGIDRNGHGTNIFYLVSRNLDPKKVCIISYQVLILGMDSYLTALNKAHHDHVKYLNISMVGYDSDISEQFLLGVMLFNGTKINVAAGNEKQNLDKKCDVYPACYNFGKRFSVIGARDVEESNFGSFIKSYEKGFQQGIPSKTGTSQATAIYTNKIILKDLKNVVY
jgi:hypothetical protein